MKIGQDSHRQNTLRSWQIVGIFIKFHSNLIDAYFYIMYSGLILTSSQYVINNEYIFPIVPIVLVNVNIHTNCGGQMRELEQIIPN